MDGSIPLLLNGAVGLADTPPVFVHSSYRTSSTWFWNKFRHNSGTLAFNEIFHPELRNMTIGRAAQITDTAWNSNHPPMAPYFLEYLPLLREDGGVQGYLEDFECERFLPPDGFDGTLTAPERAYIGGLLDHAHHRGAMPVLACTRTLGRAGAIRKAFGGYHIMVHRNLFHQWASYTSQWVAGNPFFLATVNATIRNCRQDAFLARLDAWFGDRREDPSDRRMFAVFALLHLYLYAKASAAADICFDASRAATDAVYRDGFCDEIDRRLGLGIDLSDARSNFELSLVEIGSFTAFTNEIDQFVKLIVAECQTAASASLVRDCRDAMFAELERHGFYTSKLRAFLAIPTPLEPEAAEPEPEPAALVAEARTDVEPESQPEPESAPAPLESEMVATETMEPEMAEPHGVEPEAVACEVETAAPSEPQPMPEAQAPALVMSLASRIVRRVKRE